MKIGELEQHCGECEIIEFCGNAFGYCICSQERFKDIDTDTYKKYAEQTETTGFPFCSNCQRDDCETCENGDEARDDYCEQVAEHVAAIGLN